MSIAYEMTCPACGRMEDEMTVAFDVETTAHAARKPRAVTCEACGRYAIHALNCPRAAAPIVARPRKHFFGVTENMKRLSKRTLAAAAQEYPPSINAAHPRPQTYGDCDSYDFGEGPVRLGVDVGCPFASCRYHGKHEVTLTGSIKDRFPHLEIDQMPPETTCVLRLAALDGLTLEQCGAACGMTREAIRQIESRGLEMLRDIVASDARGEEIPPRRYLTVVRAGGAVEEFGEVML